jgi:hypothetical protein
MLVVIVSLGLALSACGKRKPEALTQASEVSVVDTKRSTSSSILEWPCNHPWKTGGAVIGFALIAYGLYHWDYDRRHAEHFQTLAVPPPPNLEPNLYYGVVVPHARVGVFEYPQLFSPMPEHVPGADDDHMMDNPVQGLIVPQEVNQVAPAPFNGYNENHGGAAPVPRMSVAQMYLWADRGYLIDETIILIEQERQYYNQYCKNYKAAGADQEEEEDDEGELNIPGFL